MTHSRVKQLFKLAAVFSILSTPAIARNTEWWNIGTIPGWWTTESDEAVCRQMAESRGDEYLSIERSNNNILSFQCVVIGGASQTVERITGSMLCTTGPAEYTDVIASGPCPGVVRRDPPAMCLGEDKVGNPISVLTGRKVQPVDDWRSDVDSRFSVDRLFRVSENGTDHSASSFGANWGSVLDQKIWRYSSLAGKSDLQLLDGSVYGFSGSSSNSSAVDYPRVDSEGAHNKTLELGVNAEANRHIVRDGTGRIEIYGISSGGLGGLVENVGWSHLEEIRWPDGYTVSYERDAAYRVVAFEDNRGQRAEVTWVADVIANQIRPVIAQIEIDVDFDGAAFVPEIAVDYTYVESTDGYNELNNTQVLVTDLETSLIVSDYRFTYDGEQLVAMQDGRLDASGQNFDYANWDYSAGRAISSAHSGNVDLYQVSQRSRTPNGYEVTVTNPLNKETIYVYEGALNRERLVGIEGQAALGCLASTSSMVRDASTERVMERVNRNGSRTIYTRDSLGRVLTKTEDADGLDPRVTSYTWMTGNFRKPLTRTTAELTETFTYDADGLLLSYSQEDVLSGSPDFGEVRTWTYNYTTLASGLKVLANTDGSGLLIDGIRDVTTYEYDAQGRVTKVTDPVGLAQEVLAFGPTGQPSLIKDHKGFEWALGYDGLGRLTSTIFAPTGVNDQTTYQYDIIGQLTSMTDALGRTTSYVYDGARRLVEIVTPTGDQISYAHDNMGNVTGTTFSDQDAIAYFVQNTNYDALGRVLQLVGSNGQTTDFSHDVEDNLIDVTDAIGLNTSNTFDALNRLTDTVDRAGFTTGMEHDEDDQMTRYIDPRGIETTMAYNGFGELVAETSADRGLMTYTYDDRGLATSMTDARGIVTTYEYDDAGRLTWKRYPSDTSLNQRFLYFNATPVHYRSGDLRYAYDQTGRTQYQAHAARDQLRIVWPTIDGIQYRTGYYWREEDELVRFDYPSKNRAIPTYNVDGELTRLQFQPFNAETGRFTARINVLTFMKNLPAGPMTYAIYGDGMRFDATYDSSYRLTGLSDGSAGTILRNETYAWTSRDNLASVTDNLNPLQNQTFTYSSREKLTGADGAWGEFDYSYDAVGNRTSMTSTQAALSNLDLYNYPTDSNRLQDIAFGAGGARTLTYDAAGNVTYDNRNGQGYGYNYDAAGRMSSFAINGVIQAEYEYNYQGHQVIRRLTQLQQTIHSIFDTSGQRVAEYLYDENTGTSSLIREYIWANGVVVGVYENDTLYFVRTDHIGRPVFATDSTGTKVWEASYLPFGGVEASSGPNLRLRFPGQWFQAETGLHQNWMRDYDPTLGRYIQADPLGLVDGASVYGYALQNPGRYVDPKGEESSIQVWSGAGWGNSSFGHVSGQINGTNYSFGQSGMSVLPHSEYLERNKFRSGLDMPLNLNPYQERLLEMCLEEFDEPYNPFSNNCTDPWESCLRQQGQYFQNTLTPGGLRNSLTGNSNAISLPQSKPLVNSITSISQGEAATGRSAPWAPRF